MGRPSSISSVIPAGVNPNVESILDMPQPLWFIWSIIPVIVAVGMPVVSGLTRPDGRFSLLLDAVYGPRDSKAIVLMGLGAFLNTYVFTAVGSIMGQTLGHTLGHKFRNPRLMKPTLTGLPHRMCAAHQNLQETFPGFAMSLCFVLVFQPNSQTLIDGLALHFLLKHVLYYPAYLLNSEARTFTHILGISSLLSVMRELYNTTTFALV